MTVTDTPVEFDPFSDDYFNDPTETYRRLRDEAPVYFSEKYGFYALSRFADVLAAHRDWEGFSSAHGIELFTLSKKTTEEIAGYRSIIMMDPPVHDRLRALVSRVFTPRAIDALEPMVREVIASFLAPLDDGGTGGSADRSATRPSPRGRAEDTVTFDAVADFSAPFPVEVISRMLGVPEGERQQIRHWLDAGLHREPGQLEPSDLNMQAQLEAGMYWYQLVADKRAHPTDDMLSRLTQVTVDRGDGHETGLDDEEIAGFATLLGGAGAETVTKLVGNAVVLFWRHPDQWRTVHDDFDAIPARSRRSCATTRRRSTRVGSACRSARSRAAPFPRASRCSSSPGRRRATRARSSAPTTSTSVGSPGSRSASAMACTAASAPRWPAWRAASRSRSWRSGGSDSRSTKPGCSASTCRTWPATPTCRSPRSVDAYLWRL